MPGPLFEKLTGQLAETGVTPMAVHLTDVMTDDEQKAYHEGRKAARNGEDFFPVRHPYDPKGDNSVKWAWEQGYMDEESGVPVELTIYALKNGESV